VVAFSGGTSVAEFSGPTLSLLLARGVDIGGGTRGLLWTARRETGSAVTLRFNRYNSRGDVVGQSDAAGVTTWAATYQADGRRTGEIGTNLNPKHATGRVRELGVNRDRHRANTKEEDPTGLLNEGFRYRDMETGTFISRDPLGLVDGPNVYCYVRQNPWTAFDPEGLHEAKISGEAVDKELRLANRDHRNAVNWLDRIATSQKQREAGIASRFPYLEQSDEKLANLREAAERDVWATGARMEFLQSIRFARQAFEARRGRDGYGSFGSMAAAEAQGLSWTQAAPYFEPMPGWLIPPAQTQAMLNYVETGMAVQTFWTPGVPAAGTLSPVGRALSGGGKARLVLPAAKSAPETFYRSMSQAHYDQLLATRKLPATFETVISPTRAFAADYDGVLVQFNVRGGTTQALAGVGVRDGSRLGGQLHGNLPSVTTVENWTLHNAYFKAERLRSTGIQQINIGLGKGAGLDTFNSNILDFIALPK
jgi:RHS repeat-associated protein